MSKTTKRVKMVGINGRFVHSCLPLFYLRNELERHHPDCEVDILQFTINDNYFETLLRLSSGSPDYIFISAVIWNSDLVEKLIRDLAVCLPACRIVVGGPQAFVLGQHLTTENFTVVTGAIEAVAQTFYKDLESGTLKNRYDAHFWKMGKRRFDFPYRESDFTSHLANRHIYYESSRGCVFACSYCLSSAESGVFHKPVEVVRDELRQILRHKPKIVRFIDRTFNDLPDRALAIWKFCVAEGVDTLFHFEMAPDRFTEEMYEFLETIGPGKFQFEIGVQSTSRKTLSAVNRTIDTDTVHAAVARLAGIGTIHLHVDLILGLPFETRETFARSFADVFAMGADYIQMGLLKVLPDTPLSRSASQYGYRHSLSPPYSVLENQWMSHDTISELYWFSECVEKFMNNRYFVLVWKYLRKQGEDIYALFCELLAQCRKEDVFCLAPTQELLCRQLTTLFEARFDRDLLFELLRVDWLRCGHRYLPACLLATDGTDLLQEPKDWLYQRMPEEVEALFSKTTRNKFFKKTCFLRISQKCFDEIGIPANSQHMILCFLASRENSLHSFNNIMVL